jgi:hypothetical protein
MACIDARIEGKSQQDASALIAQIISVAIGHFAQNPVMSEMATLRQLSRRACFLPRELAIILRHGN